MIRYNHSIRQTGQDSQRREWQRLNDRPDTTPLTGAERDVLTRLAQSPILVSRTGPLGRRFMLESLKQRGLVQATGYQQSGIIYSITRNGLKAIADT